jgi:hypothetical protein
MCTTRDFYCLILFASSQSKPLGGLALTEADHGIEAGLPS